MEMQADGQTETKRRDESRRGTLKRARLLSTTADGDEEAALVAERANPAELCQPAFGTPVVGSGREQIIRILAEQRAGVGPHVLDTVFCKPALHLGERVAVLLGMPILIAQPGLAARRLILAIAQHRIEWDQPEFRALGHQAAKPEREARE